MKLAHCIRADIYLNFLLVSLVLFLTFFGIKYVVHNKI